MTYPFGVCEARRRPWARSCSRPLYQVEVHRTSTDDLLMCRIHDTHCNLPPMTDQDAVREHWLDVLEDVGFYRFYDWLLRQLGDTG